MSGGVSGLGGIFSRALDGLSVSQRGLTVVSNNIANVNTEGYAKQQFIQGTRALFGDGTFGGGVIGLGITSITDPFIERQLVNETANFGTYDGRRMSLQNIETILSDLDGNGLGGAMTAFFNSWSDLSQNPASGSLRAVVREKGRVVSEFFTTTNTQLNQQRTNLTRTMETRIDQINSYAEQIADFNRAIVNASDEATKAELSNQRMLVLRSLSVELGVNYYESEDGAMTVQLQGSGFALVNRFDSAELSLTDDPTPGGEVTISGVPALASSGSINVTNAITSGRLAGNLLDRNEVLNDKLAELDELAYNFVNEINNLHQTGYGLDGVTGRNFFAPVAVEQGASASMALDNDIIASLDAIGAAGDDPANTGVGDSEIAEGMVALQSALTMNGGTQSFNQFFASMGTEVGILAGQVNNSHQARLTLVEKLNLQRENISGVNLDEEAADLIRYQKAFDASARVLSVANQMMDTIMELA